MRAARCVESAFLRSRRSVASKPITTSETALFITFTHQATPSGICVASHEPTANPPIFIFMAGDASHYAGEFRPTEYLPLPREINTFTAHSGCDFQNAHYDKSATKSFYNVTSSFAHDKKVAAWTITGMGEFDCQDNVLLLTAHDEHLVEPEPIISLFPKSMNDRHEKGVGKKTKWLFLHDFEEAVGAREAGGEPFSWRQES